MGKIVVVCVSTADLSALVPDEGRVPHISLVFREMWDTTAPSLYLSIHPMHLAVNVGGMWGTRPS